MDFTSVILICMLSSASSAVSSVEALSTSAVCPEDSTLVDGICECNHTLCKQPPCEKILNQITNYTDSPGECCPTYSCDICPQEAISSGNCSCAPEAFLNLSGECECSDPEKSLINNECVCDTSKCPPGLSCDEESVAVKERVGCCVVVSCKRCPSDSHPYYYNDEQVEDKCVCYPCRKPECRKNEIPVLISRGRNFPDSCCDIYDCVNITCTVNGTTYLDGETWLSSHDENCKCQNGISFCKSNFKSNEPSCSYDGKIYPHLSSWTVDSCTNCTCYAGEHKCIAHMCEVVEEVTPDCPPLTTCRRICDYGFKINKYGCEVCKCKLPKPYEFRCKFLELQKMIEHNNLKENDVIQIIAAYLHDKTSKTTTTTEPSPVSNQSTNTVYYVVPVLVVLGIVAALLFKVHQSSYSPMEKKPKENDFGKQCKYELQPAFEKKPNENTEKYKCESQFFNEYKDRN